MHIADRVIVLRDGRKTGELARGEYDRAAIERLMVGRDIARGARREHVRGGHERQRGDERAQQRGPRGKRKRGHHGRAARRLRGPFCLFQR